MDDDDQQHDRVTGEGLGAKDEDSKSKDRLPALPNRDDPTPLGDTDQHSEVPSEGPPD
jgi:hypothetical protein